MENVPYRHFINPSIQPTQDFYLSLPAISYLHLNLENNSLSLKDIFQNNSEGKTIFFLNPDGNKNEFYNTLKPVTMFNTDVKINLLGAGLRLYDDYITLDISQRANSQIFAPKDLFNFLLYGTPQIEKNTYNLTNLAFNAQTFTDISLGYSHTADKQFYFGGKVKLLLGNNNKSFSHSNLNLSANVNEWNISGNGVLNSSGGDNLDIYGKFDSVRYTSNGLKSVLTVAGLGAGVDLGMSYRINRSLTFSASVTDLGFINWSKNTTNTKYGLDFTFAGLQKKLNNGYSLQDLLDSVGNAFLNAREVTNNSGKSYNTYLTPKLNVGLEQCFLNDKLSLGLLSRTMMNRHLINEELTASVNARPLSWLDASVSSSFFNGRFSSFGAGLGIKTGPLYWFTSMDYIGFENIPIPLQKIDSSLPNFKMGAAYNTQAFNVSMGVTIALNDLNWFKSSTLDPFQLEDREIETTGFRKCKCEK